MEGEAYSYQVMCTWLQPVGLLRPRDQRYRFLVGESTIPFYVEGEGEPYFYVYWNWLDGSSWTLRYGDNNVVDPCVWRNDVMLMQRTRYVLEGLVLGAYWLPVGGTDLPAFEVREVLQLKQRLIRYVAGDGTMIGEFAFRWWWQPAPLTCRASWNNILPVLCGDVVSHYEWRPPWS
ncbi:hypothetical protein [Fontivita pretiosa]|uniref:hypothetical protein n=1 Tax=Fontivita pretiosa TaxID=2989684 RepID=UPI003D166605